MLFMWQSTQDTQGQIDCPRKTLVPRLGQNNRSTFKRIINQGRTMKHPADRTAGLNSELAVEMIGNRYNLILAGARRMRELSRGDMPKITLKFPHSAGVTALLEIEAGKIGRDYIYRETEVQPRRRNKQQPL
jgi:DNA-directed RNA polymerase omega subunit